MTVEKKNVERPSAAFHAADCPTWEIPDPDPALILASFDDEAVAAYALRIRPVYERFKRIIGQVSGLLILAQTAPAQADRDQPMVKSAREQLAEAAEKRRDSRAPLAARRHADAMARIEAQLEAVLTTLDRRVDLVTPESTDLEQAMRRLFTAHGLLLAVSDDRADMTPVDFSHACCSCGVSENDPGTTTLGSCAPTT